MLFVFRIGFIVSCIAIREIAGIPTKERLKALGLSEAIVDNGPPPQPQLTSSSWCDDMAAGADWFICRDGREPWCIHPVLRCDNNPDCQDGSDEEGCESNTPPQDHRPLEGYCYHCTDLERKMLDYHNALRSQESASNMNELNWSKDAQLAARDQADLCAVPDWGENPHGNMEPDYGQNVARYYKQGPLTDDEVLNMITWWYDEKVDYNYDKDSCASGKVCGHYLAMTTAYARNLGCSLKWCDRTNNGEQRKFWNLVCDYAVWPNWKIWPTHPHQPFISGAQCTFCQPGLVCRNGLCA